MNRVACRRSLALILPAALLCSTAALAEPIAPEPPPPLDPWYEALELGVFADAYGSFNTNLPKPQEGANGFRDGSNGSRAYTANGGLNLSWVGLDASYEPTPVGGALSLRLGPTAEVYSDSCLGESARCDGDVSGLGLVKQAYASWRPAGVDSPLRLDFGKFDTIYGAEVAESHHNLNYTRGALYWLGQPLFHTGLRASVDLLPELSATALAVNGWNNSIDNNLGKTVGVQLAVRPTENLAAYVGWLGGPEQDDTAVIACPADTAYSPNTGDCFPAPGSPASTYVVDQGGANDFKAWRHLADLVVLYAPMERLRILLNADLGWEGVRSIDDDLNVQVDRQTYYGGMLAAQYAIDETYAVAMRGEYFQDPDGLQSGVGGLELATGTLTFEAAPNDFLLLRLEARGDFILAADNGQDLYKKSVREGASEMYAATLGVVVHTD